MSEPPDQTHIEPHSPLGAWNLADALVRVATELPVGESRNTVLEAVAALRRMKQRKPPWHCSFRGRSQYEVRKLIAAADARPFICDGCAVLCVQILLDEDPATLRRLRKEMVRPRRPVHRTWAYALALPLIVIRSADPRSKDGQLTKSQWFIQRILVFVVSTGALIGSGRSYFELLRIGEHAPNELSAHCSYRSAGENRLVIVQNYGPQPIYVVASSAYLLDNRRCGFQTQAPIVDTESERVTLHDFGLSNNPVILPQHHPYVGKW